MMAPGAQYQENLGFVFFDLSLLTFYTGSFEQNFTTQIMSNQQAQSELVDKFKTLLMQVRPVEVITLYKHNSSPFIRMVKHFS
jgi:hypothetical protein